jgi:hypothetical protein
MHRLSLDLVKRVDTNSTLGHFGYPAVSYKWRGVKFCGAETAAHKKGMDDTIETMIREIQDRLPAASTWIYIAIWAVLDMMQRMETHPDTPRFAEIRFPHTDIPLFTAEQAKQLEEAWPKMGQAGGGVTGALPALSAGPKAIGAALGAVVNNPEAFSIDSKFDALTQSVDSWDEALTDAAKQYGLPALEAAAPDPKFIIPFGPIPVPVIIPARLVLPTLNALLEMVRVATTFVPAIDILGKPTTLLMVFLDLARGNLYHAIFSMLGFWGKTPMFAGIGLKILRDAYMLISPDIRTELRTAVYKSGKSMTLGWIIWLFGVVSPEIVRRPVVALLDKVRALADTYNAAATQAEVRATAALKGFGSVEIPKIPSSHIPTIGDLYILQEYIHNPNIYCHPDVVALVEELRGIPPMALFLDLANIPRAGSRAYEEACAKVASVPLAQQFAPRITLGPSSS